ncbi:MAG: RNA pyrophosphohydrolase [Hyphomicrobiaceae bacterium]
MKKSHAPKRPIDPSKLGYRPCVGIMVINREGLVWIGCRADAQNDAEGRGAWWQMPQGGIDEQEDPKAAALRELYEETGIRSVSLIAERDSWINYDLPPDLLGKAWGGRYRGQKQKWFAFRFTGHDSEINIVPPDPDSIEFIAWKWAPVAEVHALIVPFKRSVYDAVLADFESLAKPMD